MTEQNDYTDRRIPALMERRLSDPHRTDQHDFDYHDRKRENECTERLTEELGKLVRFLNDPECTPENYGEEPDKEQGSARWGARIGQPSATEKKKQRHG